MDQFTATALRRDEQLHAKIAAQLDQASIRYIFHPIFPMIVQPLATIIEPGRITPISEQGQPVGEVYLMTLVRDGEPLDTTAYKLRDGVGEISINPAPIVDELLSVYGAQGAVQIKSLYNMDVKRFLDLSLNEIIFAGERYETAQAYFDRFREVRFKAPVSVELNRVLQELDASVQVAFSWAKAKAEWSNQALKSGDIKRFSPFENALFKFTGVTPIDEAMNQVALNQSALAESLPETIQGLKDAVVGSKPDWKEISAGIAAGVKEGVKEIVSAMMPSGSPTQSAPVAVKTANPKTPAVAEKV